MDHLPVGGAKSADALMGRPLRVRTRAAAKLRDYFFLIIVLQHTPGGRVNLCNPLNPTAHACTGGFFWLGGFPEDFFSLCGLRMSSPDSSETADTSFAAPLDQTPVHSDVRRGGQDGPEPERGAYLLGRFVFPKGLQRAGPTDELIKHFSNRPIVTVSRLEHGEILKVFEE